MLYPAGDGNFFQASIRSLLMGDSKFLKCHIPFFFFLISGCHIPICRRRRWEKISWQYKMVFLPIHLLQTVRFPSCSCLWGLCSTRIFGLSSYAWRNSFFCRMWDYILTKLKNISSSANPLSLWNQQSDIPCENEKHSGMKLLQHSWMKFLTPIIQFLNYAFTLKPKLCRRCHSTAPSQTSKASRVSFHLGWLSAFFSRIPTRSAAKIAKSEFTSSFALSNFAQMSTNISCIKQQGN